MDIVTQRESSTGHRGKIVNFLLVFMLLATIGAVLILAAVPPVGKDAMTHHLAVPKLYLTHGGMYEIPNLVFSYYPMNVDLLYLIPLYLGNDIVPKYIHFVFALLTAWMIFWYVRRRLSTPYALLGSVSFLSTPIVLKLSISAYVDLGLIFFSTATLLLLLRWGESGFRLRFLVLSAVACGLAMGTKYNGLITFFLLTLFSAYLYSRFRAGEEGGFVPSLGYATLFFAFALLVFAPWGLRNFLWTHNPIYPLYDGWFNPYTGGGTGWQGIFMYRKVMYGEPMWETALIPVRIFFQGQDGIPRYFDGKLNPMLFILPFFAFYRVKEETVSKQREKWLLVSFTVLYLTFAFFYRDMRIRYIAPVIPPLIILAVYGIRNLVGASQKISNPSWRAVGVMGWVIVVALLLGWNARYVVDQFGYVKPFSYLQGKLTRDQYIERYLLEYPAIQYINKELPPDSQVLFIFVGNRGYYADQKYVNDMHMNRSKFQQIVQRSRTPEDVYQGLREMGISNLLIRYDIFDKWVQSNFTEEERKLMQSFFEKYAKLSFYKYSYGVCDIINKGAEK